MKNIEIKDLAALAAAMNEQNKSVLEAIRMERVRTEYLIARICNIIGEDYEVVTKEASQFIDNKWSGLNKTLIDIDEASLKINEIFKDKDAGGHQSEV